MRHFINIIKFVFGIKDKEEVVEVAKVAKLDAGKTFTDVEEVLIESLRGKLSGSKKLLSLRKRHDNKYDLSDINLKEFYRWYDDIKLKEFYVWFNKKYNKKNE
jgi:hypothetical protein